MVRVGDNGSMGFWDWKSGYEFQALDTTAQPGSLDAESGIMSSTFDKTGLRLICGESDKTSRSKTHLSLCYRVPANTVLPVKIWKPDLEATPESHPINWKPSFARRKY